MRRHWRVSALLSGVMVAIPVLALGGGSAWADGYSPAAAAQFHNDINSLRASHGIRAQSTDSALVSIADRWTVHLASVGTLSHNPDLASEAPAGWRLLGENVGVGPDEPSLQRAFTNSGEHYGNMTNSAFDTVGIGVYIDSQGYMWVAEDYMESPAPAPPAPPPPPPPPPPVLPSHAPAPVAASAPAPAAAPTTTTTTITAVPARVVPGPLDASRGERVPLGPLIRVAHDGVSGPSAPSVLGLILFGFVTASQSARGLGWVARVHRMRRAARLSSSLAAGRSDVSRA